VTAPAFTAEILRNARIQLRPKRLIAAVIICAAISFTSIAYFFYSPWEKSTADSAQELLHFIFTSQIAVLLIGGGLYCLQSIHREKELNTFDYQRITRLTPLNLAVGKLFGAPTMIYFLVLCTMPIAFIGAYLGATSMPLLLKAYLLVLVGCITYHSFALFISLFLPRGSSAGAVLAFLAVVYLTSWDGSSEGWLSVFARLNPFSVLSLIGIPITAPGPETFFGFSISRNIFFVALCATFGVWFLLATTRNMKRDPNNYEVYSPIQALGFAVYLNLLVLGFVTWGVIGTYGVFPKSPSNAQTSFLTVSFWLFLMIGLTLLRNRDRSRRRIHEIGSGGAGWWASIWPAPYVFTGVLVVGAALLYMIHLRLHPESGWSAAMAIFELIFFALWLARDLLFLQWANLRRSRRPLVSGILYLIAYYGCVVALFYASGAWANPKRLAYGCAFFPSAIFRMDYEMWTADPHRWIFAAIVLAAEAFVFVYLQRRTLQHILTTASSDPALTQKVEAHQSL
jgi:heme/copper-type cytochrome/quinol oxidase subunit 4